MQRHASISEGDLPITEFETALIDSHCHLETDSFNDDRSRVIDRALHNGVRKMITIGASGPLSANAEAIRIAETHSSVYATVGIHPHEASLFCEEIATQLESMAASTRVVGLGESGLDYHYDHSPREKQQEVFRRFIDMAKRCDLPLSIHLRNADNDAASAIQEEGLGDAGGVIHCFSSDAAAAKRFLDLGLHISFSGIVTFKNADDVRAAAKIVPNDRILVETDSPFLAPIPYRGRRNEPVLVSYTAASLAEVRGESLATIAATTSANTERLFRLQ